MSEVNLQELENMQVADFLAQAIAIVRAMPSDEIAHHGAGHEFKGCRIVRDPNGDYCIPGVTDILPANAYEEFRKLYLVSSPTDSKVDA